MREEGYSALKVKIQDLSEFIRSFLEIVTYAKNDLMDKDIAGVAFNLGRLHVIANMAVDQLDDEEPEHEEPLTP